MQQTPVRVQESLSGDVNVVPGSWSIYRSYRWNDTLQAAAGRPQRSRCRSPTGIMPASIGSQT
jgi:hypothetical protein